MNTIYIGELKGVNVCPMLFSLFRGFVIWARFNISQSFENGLRPKVGSGGGGWGSGESGALLVSVCDAVTPGESEGGQLIRPCYYRHLDTQETVRCQCQSVSLSTG